MTETNAPALDATPAPDDGGERRREAAFELRGLANLLPTAEQTGRAYELIAVLDAAPGAHPPAPAPAPKTGRADLDDLLAKAAAAFDALTPKQQAEHRRQQREGFVRAELAMGSDADEAAYRERVRERTDCQESDRTDAGISLDARLGRLERAVGALVDALGGAVARIDYHPKARDWSAPLVLDGDGLDKLSEACAALTGEEG